MVKAAANAAGAGQPIRYNIRGRPIVIKKNRKPRSTEGVAEAKAAAKMTSVQWKKHQEGMKQKWPAPEYMSVEMPGRSHTNYRDETYSIITRWTENTKIAYRPHAKAPGTKSHIRYEKYSKAKTVGQALKLGSWPADWCWDYERGFIKVSGPVRDEPIDISQIEDEKSLSKVDLAIHHWYRRELAKNLGLDYKDLFVGKGMGESTLMRGHRLVAQREASKRLAAAEKEGRRITDEEVTKTLQEWAFARNPNRENVMPEGKDWVWSDTLGLIRDRMGDIHVTRPSLMYPAVPKIICKWLTDRLPPSCEGFKFTSLNLNHNYAARLHRDGNNFGPSMIAAFGDFTGGELNYYPEDDKSKKLEDLRDKDKVQLPLGKGLALFNGNCGHSVEPFQGERFSVVYFTSGSFPKASVEDQETLRDMGVPFPEPDEDPYAFLRPPSGGASKGQKGLPASRFWTRKELEAQKWTSRRARAAAVAKRGAKASTAATRKRPAAAAA